MQRLAVDSNMTLSKKTKQHFNKCHICSLKMFSVVSRCVQQCCPSCWIVFVFAVLSIFSIHWCFSPRGLHKQAVLQVTCFKPLGSSAENVWFHRRSVEKINRTKCNIYFSSFTSSEAYSSIQAGADITSRRFISTWTRKESKLLIELTLWNFQQIKNK